jgi:hypothetical protein
MKKRSSSYRRIYKRHYGEIPYAHDIHHKDGDFNNNDITNLVAVSIEEHYNIHYQQGDWGACSAIAWRLKMDPAERLRLVRLANKSRIGIPRPDMIGNKNPMHDPIIAKKVSDFQKGKTKDRDHRAAMSVAAKDRATIKITCEHCNKKTNDVNYTRWHGSKCLLNPNLSLTDKIRTSQFTTNNPSNTKIACDHCGVTVGLGNYARWHGDKCKRRSK